ncbi:5'-3' exonuclease [Candidatus Harpocratesius sp.]
MNSMKKFLLIDGYAMMFRAFYAVKFAPMYENKPIGAVFGCATTILQALEQFDPNFLVIAFDAPEKTFRHKMDENYKAQRSKAPDEFIEQIPLVMEMVKKFGIKTLIKPGFEADDIIGTLVKKAESKNIESFILSGDLDFLQLISDKIHLAKFNGKEPLMYNRTLTFEKMGIYPEQIIDYKAICGDSSDNYKGISGIGPKTCVNLLTEYKTFENIYKNLAKLKPKVREKFEKNQEYANHCKILAEIHTDVPVDFPLKKDNEFKLNPSNFHDFFNKVNFRSLHKRIDRLDKNNTQEQKNSSDNLQASLF